jgi:penicillin amidase
LLQGLPAFSKFNIPIGGNSGIVNATSQNHGPSWRMIVEMSSPPKAFGIYPGGQSGNPGSKYYDNLISTWASGNYLDIKFMQNKEDNSDIIFSQILNPQND